MIRVLFWLGVGWRGKAFALACIFLGVGALLSTLVPYEPYTPIEIRVAPETSCAGVEVGILHTRKWSENWHQNIETVRVSAQWEHAKTGALYPAIDGATSVPKLDQPTGTVKADLRFPTPEAPGTYTLLMQYDIIGGVLLAPRHQDVPPNPRDWLRSTNTLTVERCE